MSFLLMAASVWAFSKFVDHIMKLGGAKKTVMRKAVRNFLQKIFNYFVKYSRYTFLHV